MADSRHLNVLEGGLDFWNDFRVSRPDIRPDLSGADLRSCRLMAEMRVEEDHGGRWWKWPDLSNADMTEANLSDMCLRGVDMTGADLQGARLSRTVVDNCSMDGVNLSHAWANRAVLRSTSFAGADFNRILFDRTVLADVDLTDVAGLDNCQSMWPNSIDIQTLQRNPHLPIRFLMMMSMTDKLADVIPTVVAYPTYQSCFISCADDDKEFAKRLYGDLKENGVECWHFPEDAKMGRAIWQDIDESIRRHDRTIVVCSESSLRSNKVIRELERALMKEDLATRDDRSREVLLPIRVDEFVLDGWDHHRRDDVISKVVGDFSRDYEGSLGRLLEALRWLKDAD